MQRIQALALLVQAERILDETVGMTVAACALRQHRGRLLGGGRGEALRYAAIAPLAREGGLPRGGGVRRR